MTPKGAPWAISNGREAAGNFDRLAAVMRNVPAAVEAAGPEGERIRKTMGEELNSQIRTWTAGGVHLGYSYEKSPIIIPDGTPAPTADARHYTPNARPGGRAPHIWLKPGQSTLDLTGAGFTLLRIGPHVPAPDGMIRAAESLNVPLGVADLPEPDLLSRYQAALVLVRPDGHICWRADQFPDDPGAILDIVRGNPQPDQAFPATHDGQQSVL